MTDAEKELFIIMAQANSIVNHTIQAMSEHNQNTRVSLHNTNTLLRRAARAARALADRIDSTFPDVK